MNLEKKFTKFRAMYLHEKQQMNLVDTNDPDNTIYTTKDIFDEGEIVFSDHFKIVPAVLTDDNIFKIVPMAIKI